jgi:tetratricopeptide (TPR) repeat protein
MAQRSENGRRMRIAMAASWPVGAAIVAGLTLSCVVVSGWAADRSVTSRATDAQHPRDTDTEKPSPDAKQRIDELIRQLGSPRFTVRRTAATELDKIGPEAFDQLYAATDSADPEVAASARYLLRQITVRWTRSDDSAKVRQIFRNYGEQDEEEHKRALVQLSDLPEGEGIAGLCRIARFDRSPLISRLAAVAIILPADRDEANRSVDPEIISRELGECARPAAQWLRQFQIQLRDPAASVSGWQKLVDEEAKRLETRGDETSVLVVSEMLWNLADVYRRQGDTAKLLVVVDRMMNLGSDDLDDILVNTLQWFVDHEMWAALDQFVTKYDGRIQQAKRPLYLVALARAQEGNKELAEQLAERAWHLEPKQPLASFDEARELAGLGQLDWAAREYHVAFDNQPLDSPTGIPARVLLSVLLQDYERYQEAADVVEPILTALEKNRGLRQQYENLQRIFFERDIDLQDAASLALRQHFLLACAYEQHGDWAHQREQLLQALTPGEGDADAEDADVLIAMYRVHDADDAWRADTLRRIKSLAQTIEKQIEDNPNSGPAYNQWAWLISNTEGNYDKALRYSKRSIELATDQRTAQRTISSRASYLDTLGRCYYAVGDYENAIQNEREAVRLIPHMQVMLRQLAMFEKAAAEKSGKGTEAGGQGSGKTDLTPSP